MSYVREELSRIKRNMVIVRESIKLYMILGYVGGLLLIVGGSCIIAIIYKIRTQSNIKTKGINIKYFRGNSENMDRTTAVQRRPDIYNLYTKRIMLAMSEGSHPFGASSISNQLFPLVEDAMRHLENGTAAMFDYFIHDGRKTIELEELSILIPQAWSIPRNYVCALNSTERHNAVHEAQNLAYRLRKLRFPTLVHMALMFSETTNIKFQDSDI